MTIRSRGILTAVAPCRLAAPPAFHSCARRSRQARRADRRRRARGPRRARRRQPPLHGIAHRRLCRLERRRPLDADLDPLRQRQPAAHASPGRWACAARSASRPSRWAAAGRRPATCWSSPRTMAATNSSSSTRSTNGRLTLLTDGGKSRNEFGGWSHDGKLIGLQLDPAQRHRQRPLCRWTRATRRPNRRVAEVKGGGWGIADFAPGGAHAPSVDRIYLDHQDATSYLPRPRQRQADSDRRSQRRPSPTAALEFAPDGTLWVTSDEGSDVQRLGRLDPATGRFTPVEPDRALGRRQLRHLQGRPHDRLRHQRSGHRQAVACSTSPAAAVRRVAGLPAGTIGGLEFAPWGTLGLSLTSAKSPTDAYSLDPATLQAHPLDRRARPAASTPTSTSSPSWSR